MTPSRTMLHRWLRTISGGALALVAGCSDGTATRSVPDVLDVATAPDTGDPRDALEAVDTLDAPGDAKPPKPDLILGLGDAHVLHTLDPAYLSFTVDIDVVARRTCPGCTSPAAFDFAQPRLATLTRALGPAYLRIGGTEADRVYYDMSEHPVTAAPAPYESLITRANWDPVCAFAKALDLQLLFTLNAGPGPRAGHPGWTADNARTFLAYTASTSCPVKVWEFGNEVNAFTFSQGFTLDGATYADDLSVVRALVHEVTPEAWLAGPASAYWPELGEAGAFMPTFMPAGGQALDIVTWHYYPQQSSRCPFQTVLAEPETMLDPANLDEVATWASEVNALAVADAPDAQVWLGETGHAQCGGEPGISGTFVSSFWWLDQLGLMAQMGQRVSMRQDLVGDPYQLIDKQTLLPTPDYFASVLWKRLMGTRVLAPTIATAIVPTGAGPAAPSVRVYAHCSGATTPGAVTFLVIRLDAGHADLSAPADDLQVAFDATLGTTWEAFTLTAPELLGTTVELNGAPWTLNDDGTLPPMTGAPGHGALALPPHSLTFVRFANADLAACR